MVGKGDEQTLQARNKTRAKTSLIQEDETKLVYGNVQVKDILQNIFIYTCLNKKSKMVFTHYSPALEKWGYTGFTLSFRGSVVPWFRDSVIPWFRHSVNILFPLNILRTN